MTQRKREFQGLNAIEDEADAAPRKGGMCACKGWTGNQF